ncbi:MAG: cytochrome c biogenesis protein [Ilumatobacteraceae bacterium]
MTTIDPTEKADDAAPAAPTYERTTSTRGTRIIGGATIIAMAWLVAFGLLFSPADYQQDEAVRLLYVHVPTIWVAYLAFIVTAFSSGMYLFRSSHSLGWDRLAGASAEIGVLFVAVTLAIGAMLGRLTWGVFWQWDARLTTTAMLFVTYIGYLAVRRLGGSHEQRARRSAVIGLLAVLLLPLVHWSVRLWRSLHQEATVLDTDLDPDIEGLMAFSLFVGVVAFSLLYLWLLIHRSRTLFLEDVLDEHGLDDALAARRAEARAGES